MDEVQEVMAQLAHKSSAKRRSAAKKLRRLKDASTGPALEAALAAEVQDRRTWETQYHMIMALAESKATHALPLLKQITRMDLEPMVHVAAGDALVRLSGNTVDAVREALRNGEGHQIEGALRAVAMLHEQLPDDLVRAIMNYASVDGHTAARFWVAASAAGWDVPGVRDFLTVCLNDKLPDTRRAAEAALAKRFIKWKPL